MKELLKLCGFTDKEPETELARIEKVFKRLGITDEDIETGKQRLHKYYDIDLQGLRKVFRLIIKELVNAILAKEDGREKLIYGFMCPGIDLLGSAFMTKSDKVFSIHHSWAFHIVIGCIFGKIVPVLEDAEKTWLKAGAVAHCANVKTIAGPLSMGLFPNPDMLVTSAYTCETSSKTLDILHELYDIPVWYIDHFKDRAITEYPGPSDRVAKLTAESIKRFVEKVQSITGFEIEDDLLIQVKETKRKLEKAITEMRKIVINSDPLLISSSHENIWGCLLSLTSTIDGIEEATDAINMLCNELKEKAARGEGDVEKGAPRVLAICPAGQTDPRLEYLLCEVGIAVVGIDFTMGEKSKKHSDDPYLEMALGSQQVSLELPPYGRIPLIINACKKLKVNGVLDRYHVGCRAVVADALLIEEAVKKELGIPVMVMEWENFDPRSYNHQQFKNRLEIFREMMIENTGNKS
ncbi:MAG: 2-hydroxyacyl-CoA dehydratase [Spirochaetes bacterium]|nr:2-hydroxyacyl-CoA dehydratase [Spirochaetota bacterium]